MFNPFMTLAHCSRFAVRKASHTGKQQHVIKTWVADYPLQVVDDWGLEACIGLELDDILFTADPTDLDEGRVVQLPTRRPD